MKAEEFNNICKQLKTGTELILKLNHYEHGEKLNGLFLNFTEAGKYPGMMSLITPQGSVAILSDWISELQIIPKTSRHGHTSSE
ncbi:MAG: hypothetical protein AB1489_04670 [Acidobacteriota bacterium]